MPFRNEDGTVALIFSGADYSDPRSADRLRRRGHALPAEGKSYLVYLYEEEPDFPKSLNGFFQGLVVDRTRGRAILFNDRYGMHRIYFHSSGDSYYFSAEAKSILAVRRDCCELDPRGLGEYISFGCVLENRTLFRGIEALPPAAAWVFSNGRLRTTGTYFQPAEWEGQEPLGSEQYFEELLEAFTTNLPYYFSGKDQTAVALTGGLDTRAIMAWNRLASRPAPCYTFGGMMRETRDVKIARRVARVRQSAHEVIQVGNEFLNAFPDYAARTVYLTDGCVSVANSPDLYLSERARRIAPAKIVGTWGSELLRQATTFKPSPPLNGLFQPEVLDEVRRAEANYRTVRNRHALSFAAFCQTPWAMYGVEALEQTQLEIRAPFLANDFVRAVYRAPDLSKADLRARLIAAGNSALACIPSDRGLKIGGRGNGPGRLFQEFTFKCEYAFDMGMPNWLARLNQAVSPLSLEKLFLGRHKFLHFRSWYRGPLAGYVREVLLDPQALHRPFIESQKVEGAVESHIRGYENHTSTIHCLLTLELLRRSLAGTQANPDFRGRVGADRTCPEMDGCRQF